MINKLLWKNIAQKWSIEKEFLDIECGLEAKGSKKRGMTDEDFSMFDDISNNEIDDILADLGLDDL